MHDDFNPPADIEEDSEIGAAPGEAGRREDVMKLFILCVAAGFICAFLSLSHADNGDLQLVTAQVEYLRADVYRLRMDVRRLTDRIDHSQSQRNVTK